MADVMSIPPVLDPSKPAKISISLGSELTRSAEVAENRVASIQWNYKPHFQPNQAARIRSSRRPSDPRVNLTLEKADGEGEYQYAGSQQPSGSCALIYDPLTKGFVLEKLDADFTFNLHTTPSNHDRSQVTCQYPQLDIGVSDIESDDGSTTEAPAADTADRIEADAKNPYDYRHFLKRRRTSSPEPSVSRPSNSPAVPIGRTTRTKVKPRPQPRAQQRPKRPTREESLSNGDDSDDGGLIIEMGDSPRPPRFGNGAVVFNHDRRNGPISLRSAASSMSPASIRHDSGNEEGESDNDVEHFRLPSPESRPNGVAHGNEEADEDEDDLVEDLMQAMESQEEEEDRRVDAEVHGQEQTIRRTVEESSSESEEE